jgi:hypothetical protein
VNIFVTIFTAFIQQRVLRIFVILMLFIRMIMLNPTKIVLRILVSHIMEVSLLTPGGIPEFSRIVSKYGSIHVQFRQVKKSIILNKIAFGK